MKITDEQRSMIASAFSAAFRPVDKREFEFLHRISLCCGPDATGACARIVGKRHAEKLRTFFYERLGCAGYPTDPAFHEEQEQYYLDKISALEVL